MTRHVALLRGINVGGNKGVAMAELRSVAEGLSLGEPRTLLQSGNLVFDSEGVSPADLEPRLEVGGRNTFGIEDQVSALQQRAGLSEGKALRDGPKLGHGHALIAADIDSAQQGHVPGHADSPGNAGR